MVRKMPRPSLGNLYLILLVTQQFAWTLYLVATFSWHRAAREMPRSFLSFLPFIRSVTHHLAQLNEKRRVLIIKNVRLQRLNDEILLMLILTMCFSFAETSKTSGTFMKEDEAGSHHQSLLKDQRRSPTGTSGRAKIELLSVSEASSSDLSSLGEDEGRRTLKRQKPLFVKISLYVGNDAQ